MCIRDRVKEDLALDPTIPDQTTTLNPLPAAGSPLLSTNRATPADGFFTPAAYKGAFGNENWAQGWSKLSRLGYFPEKTLVDVTSDISASETWTADNEYVLGTVIYVTNGATLTIEPGTVVRGLPDSATPGTNDPGALVVTRGSKIMAMGTADFPISFTDEFDDNVPGSTPTFPYDNKIDALDEVANWGGVILLGTGYVANGTGAGPDASVENQIEGLTAAGGLGLYGGCDQFHDPLADPSVCDDDDSGVMNYVSISYGGFNLAANNEINGLTLGAVGRGTDLDYIEVFQNKDDGVEFFGGAANIKHLIVANVGDDSIDYDEGWRGKVQFALAMQGIPGTGADKGDKGGEHDGGVSPDASQPYAIPTFYNLTSIGHGQKTFTDYNKNTGLHIRDNAGGRFYNSAFLDYAGASVLIEGGSTTGNSAGTSGERSITSYASIEDGELYQAPTSDFQLELQDNVWYCIGRQESVGDGSLTTEGTCSIAGTGCLEDVDCPGGETCVDSPRIFGGSSGKIHYDNGMLTNAALGNDYVACAGGLPIQSLEKEDLALDPTIPDQTTTLNPLPSTGSPLLTSDRSAPADGFFTPAAYKGAFGGQNWAAGWSKMARLGYFPVCQGGVGPAPDVVDGLLWTSTDSLAWDGVGNAVSYDLFRSDSASDFSGADLLEDGDFDTVAADGETPLLGSVFYYLVRGNNSCGAGSAGTDSNGNERVLP